MICDICGNPATHIVAEHTLCSDRNCNQRVLADFTDDDSAVGLCDYCRAHPDRDLCNDCASMYDEVA